MKILIRNFSFFLLFTFGFLSGIFGQSKYRNMPEKERKALEKVWKNKLRDTEPLAFRDTYKKYQTLSREGSKIRSQIKKTALDLDSKEKIAMSLREQIDSIKNERSGKNMATEENEKSAMGSGDFDKGLVFKVQVGAMKKINNNFKEGNKKYVAEEDADGTLKYTLGYFRVYEDADNFKRVLRGMGLKEAKVEAYQDKKRIELKEALYKLREDSTPPASGYEPVEEDW